MKKNILFLCVSFLIIAFVACTENKDEPQIEENAKTDTIYIGKSTVLSEPVYAKDSIEVQLTKTSSDTIQILLKKIRFAAQMPITLDITVPGVFIQSEKKGELILVGNNIVPTTSNLPYPAYTVTNLSGTATDSTFNLSLNFGSFPVTYQGKRK